MDIHNIHTIYAGSARADARSLLSGGESPMPMAPSVEFANGKCWIPQQYLLYQQTQDTIAAILNDIDPMTDILLFSGQDENGLYLQVGTLGPDNYKRKTGSTRRRLVYGRKWRIESYTPTSEVIQTAFLAIKKACEHDVRERFTITGEDGKTGTPFSTHIDLPLMAHFPELTRDDTQPANSFNIARWLDGIQYERRPFLLEEVTHRKNGNVIVDLRLAGGFPLTLVVQTCSKTVFLHELMDALVQRSDHIINEQFLYRGFARFSQALSPHRIAALSVATRSLDRQSEQFRHLRKQLNDEIDAQRVPVLGNDSLSHKNRRRLEQETELGGHLPHGVSDFIPLSVCSANKQDF